MSSATATIRATYHHGDLRHELLEAARDLIDEKGVGGFTLREAARVAGVNHRAAYRHFSSKEDLIVAVAIEAFDRLRSAMVRRIRGLRDPRDRLDGIFRAYVRFALSHPSRYRMMFGPNAPRVGASPELRRAVFRVIGIIEPEAESLLDSAGRPVRDAVIGSWSLVHGLCELMISGHVSHASIRRAETYVLERLRAAPLLR